MEKNNEKKGKSSLAAGLSTAAGVTVGAVAGTAVSANATVKDAANELIDEIAAPFTESKNVANTSTTNLSSDVQMEAHSTTEEVPTEETKEEILVVESTEENEEVVFDNKPAIPDQAVEVLGSENSDNAAITTETAQVTEQIVVPNTVNIDKPAVEPVAENIDEPAVEPIAEPEPIVEPVAENIDEPAVEPIAEPEPIVEPVAVNAEPIAEPIAEPELIVEPVAVNAELIAELIAEPEPIVEPVAENTVELIAENTVEPAVEPIAEQIYEPEIHISNIEIASSVSEDMSFGQAFAAARAEVGSGGAFEWHGQIYNTYTAEEWAGLSDENKNEYFSCISNVSNSYQGNSYADNNTTNPDTAATNPANIAENNLADTLRGTMIITPETNNDDDVKILGVYSDEDTIENHATIIVDDKEFVLIDIDGDGRYDVIEADINNNGEYDENEIAILDDIDINVSDLQAYAEDNNALYADDNDDFMDNSYNDIDNI